MKLTAHAAQRGRLRGRGNGLLFLLSAVPLAMSLHLTAAALTFQRPTDILGVASVFQEGTGLPTRNFTMSFAVRSSSGRNVVNIQRAGYVFSVAYFPGTSGLLDVILDSTSYLFDPSLKFSAEDAIMTMRTWTITYDDVAGELSLFIDTNHIETKQVPQLFSGVSIFGSDAIQFFTFGMTNFVSYDSEGNVIINPANEIDGLYGQFDTMQLWSYALNASEIVRVVTSSVNRSLALNETGLCVHWRADEGFGGTRIPNLGSAGSTYDGVLGQFAVGIDQTNDVLGSGCDTFSATSPTWANDRTGGLNNTPPIADNQTLTARGPGVLKHMFLQFLYFHDVFLVTFRRWLSQHAMHNHLRRSILQASTPTVICSIMQ